DLRREADRGDDRRLLDRHRHDVIAAVDLEVQTEAHRQGEGPHRVLDHGVRRAQRQGLGAAQQREILVGETEPSLSLCATRVQRQLVEPREPRGGRVPLDVGVHSQHCPRSLFHSDSIQSFNGAVTTRGLRRRSATVRLEVNSSACRSPATTVCTAASAPATPPVCWARKSGRAIPAPSPPMARAFATSRPWRIPPEATIFTDGPTARRTLATAAAVGIPHEENSAPSSAIWPVARSCSTRTQLVPPRPLTSRARPPQTTRRRATACAMPP